MFKGMMDWIGKFWMKAEATDNFIPTYSPEIIKHTCSISKYWTRKVFLKIMRRRAKKLIAINTNRKRRGLRLYPVQNWR